MPALGQFLQDIASRYGISINIPEFTPELRNSAVDIPNEVAALFNVDLLTEDAVFNSPKIKGRFLAQALNPLDDMVREAISEYGISGETATSILGEAGTYKRVPALIKAIKDAEAAKAAAPSKEKGAFEQQINELKVQLAQAQESANLAVANKEKEWSDAYSELAQSNIIAKKNIDTSRFPAEIMHAVVRDAINKALEAKGAKLALKGRNLELVQAQDESLQYMVNNVKLTPEAFIDEVLATNKLLAVSQPAAAPDQHRGPSNPGHYPSGTPPQVPSRNLNSFDRALADYQANSR